MSIGKCSKSKKESGKEREEKEGPQAIKKVNGRFF
jgi:hypothetical protein